jgi:hypothetical protein
MADPKYCGAPERQGLGDCTRPAGCVTEHAGIGRCKLLGGKTPSHNAAAAKEQACRDVEMFGAAKDVHPAQALLELVQCTAGEVDYWHARVRGVEETD